VSAIVGIAFLPVGAFVAIAVVWLVLLAASAWAGLGPFRLSRSAFVALPFALAAVPVIFLPVADPLAASDIGPWRLTISASGLVLFATIATKSWVSVQVALLLTFTTPFHDLIDALRDLHLPRVMVAIIGFMYRYLAVIGDEAARLLRARASRAGASPDGRAGGSIRWRARVTGAMVGSLFIRSYERSERVYAAMQARGFDGTFVHLAARRVGAAEWAALVVLIALLAGLVLGAHLWLPHA
jgi:cobalt/nickel transport system permease protein